MAKAKVLQERIAEEVKYWKEQARYAEIFRERAATDPESFIMRIAIGLCREIDTFRSTVFVEGTYDVATDRVLKSRRMGAFWLPLESDYPKALVLQLGYTDILLQMLRAGNNAIEQRQCHWRAMASMFQNLYPDHLLRIFACIATVGLFSDSWRDSWTTTVAGWDLATQSEWTRSNRIAVGHDLQEVRASIQIALSEYPLGEETPLHGRNSFRAKVTHVLKGTTNRDVITTPMELSDLVASQTPDPARMIQERLALAEWLRNSSLTRSEREVIERVLEGVPEARIAQKTGRKEVTVRVLLSRARAKLRSTLPDYA